MGFGADQLEALVECVELVNTGRATSSALPGVAMGLASLDEVIAFGRRHRVENLGAAGAGDVPRLHELRARLDAVVANCESGDETTAIAGLNMLLAETGAVPQIVTHDGRPPHIHVTRAAAPLADRIAAHSAMGLAELIVAGEGGRVRTCASPRCDAVFIDLSRNQSRRYCDSRICGNRIHVAAYRSRRSIRPVEGLTEDLTADGTAKSSAYAVRVAARPPESAVTGQAGEHGLAETGPDRRSAR